MQQFCTHDTWAMFDPCNCVGIDQWGRDMWISIAQTFCTLHVHSEQPHTPSCAPTLQRGILDTQWVSTRSFESRGNLFTQWVKQRHEPITCLVCSKDESQHGSFRQFRERTNHIRTSHPGGVNKKSSHFASNASQVRA